MTTYTKLSLLPTPPARFEEEGCRPDLYEQHHYGHVCRGEDIRAFQKGAYLAQDAQKLIDVASLTGRELNSILKHLQVQIRR